MMRHAPFAAIAAVLLVVVAPSAQALEPAPSPKPAPGKPDKDPFHEGWWKNCKSGDDGKPDLKRVATGCSMFGVRFAFTGLDVSPPRGVTVGVQVHTQDETFERIGVASIHGTHRSGLGGGGSGFEGELGGTLTFGVRAPVGKKHGPFVRGGIGGHVLGNDLFYSSLLELPRGEIGYQFLSGMNVVELAGTVGYAIDGRYGQRNLAPLPYSPQVVPIGDGAKGQVMTGLASACAFGYIFALCFDMRMMSEDGLGPFGSSKRSTYYGGLTLGFSGTRG